MTSSDDHGHGDGDLLYIPSVFFVHPDAQLNLVSPKCLLRHSLLQRRYYFAETPELAISLWPGKQRLDTAWTRVLCWAQDEHSRQGDMSHEDVLFYCRTCPRKGVVF